MSVPSRPGAGAHGPTRRGVLLGAAGAAGAVALPAAPARAAVSAAPVWTMPVTPDRAVVVVDTRRAPGLTMVEVREPGARGAVLGRATLTASGRALVPVPVPARSARRVEVSVGGVVPTAAVPLRTTVELNTTDPWLRSSSWRVVNKLNPLAADDVPADLVTTAGVALDRRAATALTPLLAAARARGLQVAAANGYRSHSWQERLYRAYVARDGQAAADTYSARPGHSEHQTGLALDLQPADGRCSLQECFGATPEGRFLAEHGRAAGFVVRYPAEAVATTGYRWEPWHLRYVGTWLASYLTESGTATLEQAFGLPAATDYR